MPDHPYVYGGALFLPPGSPAIPKVKKAMRFRNPEYDQIAALRAKGKKVAMPPQWIYRCYTLPDTHKWAGGLMAPRHFDIEEVCKDGLSFNRIDRTTFPEADPVQLAPHIKLRDYQEACVDLMADCGNGYIVASCGSGKTTIGMGALTRFNTKALILVHTKDLAKQWISRCSEQLTFGPFPLEATLVGDGEKDDSGRVVVALFQTVMRMPFEKRYEWAKQFGLVIVDECHHIPSSTYNFVMCCMPARNRFGLTATEKRRDKLDVLLPFHFGIKVKEIDIRDLAKRGLVLLPKVEWLQSGFVPNGEENWADLVTEMSKDSARNTKIATRVAELVAEGLQVLVLSDRVDHCEKLAHLFDASGVPATALVGTMNKKSRAEAIRLADEGHYRIITATTLADEGLDLPGLGAVVLTTPTKTMGRVQQRIGRVMRPAPGKPQPVVVDVVDNNGAFRGLAKKRKALYERLGCHV